MTSPMRVIASRRRLSIAGSICWISASETPSTLARPRGHVALIERGQHQTHRRNGTRVPRFLRLFEPFGEGLTHRRHASPAVSYKAYPASCSTAI